AGRPRRGQADGQDHRGGRRRVGLPREEPAHAAAAAERLRGQAMTIQFGYCTNVHAGPDLEQTRANLQRYALAVKQRVRPNEPMGVGLWLAASAARKLVGERRVTEFADWLAEVGLVLFTFNGFPFGDFHQAVVK